jgi:hypothetical protein
MVVFYNNTVIDIVIERYQSLILRILAQPFPSIETIGDTAECARAVADTSWFR